MSTTTDKQKCDICHAFSDDNSFLLVKNYHGEQFNICLNCINIFTEERKKILNGTDTKFNINIEIDNILESLNTNIFGQQNQKEQISSLISMHYSNILNNNLKFKNNILLIGPTGSGKTMMIKNIANILKVPMVQIDATTLTEAGYVGHDVDICIDELIRKTNGDIEKAQHGIVFIDELDKIQKKESNGRSKDVGGVGVQQALLKLIEGSTVYVPSPQNPNTKIAVNTENILFIFAGAFEGLYDIINDRVNGTSFNFINNGNSEIAQNNGSYLTIIKQVTADDLFKYGMISELIGRLPNIIVLDKLTDENMLMILKQVFEYYSLSMNNNVVFNINHESSMKIIENVRKDKTGARGISFQVWKLLADHFYHIYKNKHNKVNVQIELVNNIPTIIDIKIEEIKDIIK
jgi:ATP-dependent Clp protease ATP-binding subunit ClpX